MTIVEAGDPVLRALASELDSDERRAPELHALVADMRDAMRGAPGVGLAAPQIGRSLRVVVIEDLVEYQERLTQPELDERERAPLPFHVLINPTLTVIDATPIDFFEGCLSLPGLVALVPRARRVRVEALDEKGVPFAIEASGWYARILQHELDHLNGVLYVDRMAPRTLCTAENHERFWRDLSAAEVRARLGG
jgi:peptide deformylase